MDAGQPRAILTASQPAASSTADRQRASRQRVAVQASYLLKVPSCVSLQGACEKPRGSTHPALPLTPTGCSWQGQHTTRCIPGVLLLLLQAVVTNAAAADR